MNNIHNQYRQEQFSPIIIINLKSIQFNIFTRIYTATFVGKLLGQLSRSTRCGQWINQAEGFPQTRWSTQSSAARRSLLIDMCQWVCDWPRGSCVNSLRLSILSPPLRSAQTLLILISGYCCVVIHFTCMKFPYLM